MDTRKQQKRFLAILLSICMLLTMLPMGGTTVFAAGDETIISSDTTWETQTISNDVRIESGVTLTINGVITVSGEIRISGGGTIARGNGDAYFDINSDGILTLDGVTVDGKNIDSGLGDSMLDVDDGTLNIINSTVQNCVKTQNNGGAINVYGGKLTIENTTIQDCSARSYGGAVYLDNGAAATIKSGIFSGNKMTGTGSYGGGFVYNRGSTLTIEGGSFQNNSASKGGAIYNTGIAGTKTYILGGVFEGNTARSAGYEGSGAVFYSAVNTAETVLYISGSARFGDGEANSGQDGIYLDSSSSGSTLRKTQISSALQYLIHIYVACAENRVIAEGIEGCKLTAADMTKIQFHDVGSNGTDWYAWLNSTDNEVYLSAAQPYYVIYDANGATGLVTDNQVYSSGSSVAVQSANGLVYEGHTFKGWNTEKDGAGTVYQPGDAFTITNTTTLYAQWEAVYNVWVNGVQVTEQNASDVLGDTDGEDATVSYSAESRTLTLNGADITADNIAPDGSYAAIISYDDLNIILAEDSENKITLTGSADLTGVIAMSKEGGADAVKNITVSGGGSLNIDLNSSGYAAIGIEGNNVAIENADITANGSTGISSMDSVSITGESTVKATGTASAIAAGGNITLSETLIAEGRADAAAGELSAVEINTVDGYKTFILPSNPNAPACYVEIGPAPSYHRHAVCGEADCTHDGHTAVVYTALESDVSGKTLTGGNYCLTEDITNVEKSILITETVSLCLNGHTISGSAEDGIFRIGEGGVLNVCDCAGNGKITESGGHNPIFLHSGGTLNLYSGAIESRITAVVIDEDPSSGGSNLMGGTVNIYGGAVSSASNSHQAIKVNAGMTNAAVNISGGSVTSQNNGISAASGTICVSGGTIAAENGYGVSVTGSSSKVYLSGGPSISGGRAGVSIYSAVSADDAVLVLHAKDSQNSPYTGDGFSIRVMDAAENRYIAQGAADDKAAEKFSLADLPNYYLIYNETNSAIQIKEYTYTVTLPSGQEGYTVTAASGSSSPVKKGGSFRFTVTVDSAGKYYKTGSFAVKANGSALTPDNSGVYTISNIDADQSVTVAADGTYKEASDTADFEITYLPAPSDPFELSGTEGTGGWYTSDVTIAPPEGYTVSDALNGEYSDALTISESGKDVIIYLKNESGQMTDAVSAGDIKIDKDDPAITAAGDITSYLKSDTAKITVSDSTSGVAKVEVKKDNGEFEDITDSYANGYSVKENGTYTFRVTDNAGRWKEAELIYNRIDSQTPVVTIDATHGGEVYTSAAWTNQDVTLTLKNKTGNPGITTYQYRVDGGGWKDYTAPILISADTDADGAVYEFKAFSASGVESETVSITVRLDKTAPSIAGVTSGLTYCTTQKVTVTDTNLDSVTLNNTPVAFEDGMLTLPGDVEAVYTIKATDRAGNTAAATVTMKPIASLWEELPDKESVEALIGRVDTLLNTGNLTETEAQNLKALKDRAEALLAQLEAYRFTEGNGSVWTKGSAQGLTFAVNGAYSKFTGIEIDGNAVGGENYTASSGSTVITLKADYLNTLTAGEHTIAALYTDGRAAGAFTIAEKPADEETISSQTGDDLHIVRWIILMLISGGAVLTLGIRYRSRKGMSK